MIKHKTLPGGVTWFWLERSMEHSTSLSMHWEYKCVLLTLYNFSPATQAT